MEKAGLLQENMQIDLLPKDDRLEIGIYLDGTLCQTDFDELSKLNVFKGSGLPKTISFNRKFSGFISSIEIYRAIAKAIAARKKGLIPIFIKMLDKRRDDLKARLYSSDMTPDEDVVSLALQMQNEFKRTGLIPNIALIGEAGTGKSVMAKRLGSVLFNKEVMNLSPSDLKSPYKGDTKTVVLDRLLEAAGRQKNGEPGKILFIDEAYALMKDTLGQEAVSILLPLMTHNRDKIDSKNWEKDRGDIIRTIDFKTGEVTENGTLIERINPSIPPIWIGGYEDDIRLMTNQNQGLFRRFDRVTLKAPTTSQLYEALFKELESAQNKLSQGEDSELLHNVAAMSDIAKEELKLKSELLIKQFRDYEIPIKKFFRWGTQPQNSKNFGNYAGVKKFISRCLDGIDLSSSEKEIKAQIDQIITATKRDIKHQIDTVRRKSDGSQGSSSERVQMVLDNKTRFHDLVGCDTQVEYMRTIIDMLVNQSNYEQFGITVPKGVLLLGQPGVGKTFIAQAMAGELQQRFEEEAPNKRVGFMSLSAPEITSKPVSFIGSIFDEAEEYDVCVIFIDEVDAIAKNRFQNICYSHFIELIKQMDGVDQRSNVFVLAATNAPESLDPAFVRTGRIDKQLEFMLPDLDARCELARRSILKRCGALENFMNDAKGQKGVSKLASEVAKITPGNTPGDIESIINEAFIMYDQDRRPGAKKKRSLGKGAPKFGDPELGYLYRCIYEAVERNDIGDPRSIKKGETFNVDKNDMSRSSISVHEVGHALVRILHNRKPFERITSLPRGSALGYVMPIYEKRLTKADFEDDIRFSMGGRIAEEIVYGKENISTGASQDMKYVTSLARFMVEQVGFTDEFEFMVLQKSTARYLGKNEYNCSESFRERSDHAVNKLIKRLYQETREILTDKRDLIIALAEQVFKRETMTGKEFEKLYQELNNTKMM